TAYGHSFGEKRLGVFKPTGIEAVCDNSRKESTGFNDPARRLLHCSFLLAVAIPGPHPIFTNCSQCVLRFTQEEYGCERGNGNRNNRFPSVPPNYRGEIAMQHPGFFERAGPFALRDIAERVGAALTRKEDGYRMIENVQTLRGAGPGDLAF